MRGRARSKAKSRVRSRKSRPRVRRVKSKKVKSTRKSRSVTRRRRSLKKPKVSPAAYNRRKCMVTPGWEWVQGKGCRKLRPESPPHSRNASESSDTESPSPPVKQKRGVSKVKESPSRFNKEKCLVTPGWTWTAGGCRKIREYNVPAPACSPCNAATTIDAAAALQEAAQKSKE